MSSAVHSFIIDKNSGTIKKKDRIKKYVYSHLFVIKYLWSNGIELMIEYKESSLPQNMDRVRVAFNIQKNQFVMW